MRNPKDNEREEVVSVRSFGMKPLSPYPDHLQDKTRRSIRDCQKRLSNNLECCRLFTGDFKKKDLQQQAVSP
jgi:hypothetical protein